MRPQEERQNETLVNETPFGRQYSLLGYRSGNTVLCLRKTVGGRSLLQSRSPTLLVGRFLTQEVGVS